MLLAAGRPPAPPSSGHTPLPPCGTQAVPGLRISTLTCEEEFLSWVPGGLMGALSFLSWARGQTESPGTSRSHIY